MRIASMPRRSRDRAGAALGVRAPTYLAALYAVALVGAAAAGAAEPGAETVRELQQEVERLREENASSQAAIRRLEEKLAQMEAAQTARIEEIDRRTAQASPDVSAAAPGDRITRLFGENRFLVTGWGSAGYDWENAGENSNTFSATFVPIFLFRVGERVLFEAEPEIELGSDETEVNLEYAQADVILNDYATMVAGKFLLPFGEFIQQLHPAWINRLVSNPLPYLEGEDGGLIPFSDVGFQLRGGTRLFHSEGVDLGYSAFITNGPRFEDDELGAPLVSNNLDANRGKGFGARVALYPLPLARELGRLEVGASTYDGTWDEKNDLWFYSWGIDFAYQWEELELRAEYLRTLRQMLGVSDDRRDGWYVQAAYKLSRLDLPVLRRMEAVLRYSGLNQSRLFNEDGQLIRIRDPQQIALGLDYWLTPSVAGKVEYDFDFASGMDDAHAIRAQIAVGF